MPAAVKLALNGNVANYPMRADAALEFIAGSSSNEIGAARDGTRSRPCDRIPRSAQA